MLLVALVAVGVWGWRMWQLREDYRSRAALYAGTLADLGKMQKHTEDAICATSDEIRFLKKVAKPMVGFSGTEWSKEAIEYEQRSEEAQKWMTQYRNDAARWKRLIDQFACLKLKYERAARYPWLPVEPDPPKPE
jgi:hypothetical protein